MYAKVDFLKLIFKEDKMRKLIYLFLIIVIAIGCSKSLGVKDLNQTGLYDQSGNLIKDTLIYTNKLNFTGRIPTWATNYNFDYIITTNVTEISKTNYQVSYESNYYFPSYPERPTDYYKVRVPFAVNGTDYVTISYRDVTRAAQLWLDQIKRKGSADGYVFAIRNRDNDGGFWYQDNCFQNIRDGRYDYYYFADNGDIVYKGGNPTNKNVETVVKKFVGAIIIDYIKDGTISDLRSRTGEWTIGAIYRPAMDVNEARSRFKGGGVTEGVYDFIAARNTALGDWNVHPNFIRQYYNTQFIEVLVLNPYNNHDMLNCLGVDSYYYYPKEALTYKENNVEGAYPIKGFTEKNLPYMTNEYTYLGNRPEVNVQWLNKFVFFSHNKKTGHEKDMGDRVDNWPSWNFLAMPGNAN